MLAYPLGSSLSQFPRVKKVAAFLLLLLPLALISLKSAGSILCLLLIAVSLFFRKSGSQKLTTSDQFFIFAFLSPLLVTLIQAILISEISGKYFEISLRFSLPLIAFIYFRNAEIESRWLGYGCLLGLASALIIVTVGKYVHGVDRPSNYFMNSLPFSGVTVVFAYLAFYLLTPTITNIKHRVLLGGAIFSVCAFILSITLARGSLLALTFTGAFFLFTSSSLNKRWKTSIIISVVAVATIAFSVSDEIRHRVTVTAQEIDSYLIQDEYTGGSISIRFELWKSSLLTFQENPIIGAGKGKFQTSLEQLVDQKKIHEMPLFSHAHNEFFTFIAEQGVLGVISYALLFIAPFCFFIRYKNSSDSRVKALASGGLSTVINYFLLGITNVVLLQMTVLTLYAFLTCYLASQIIFYQKPQPAVEL